jgi:hypothetical protein
MIPKTKSKEPEIIFKGNKARAIILDIKEYQRLLEKVEDEYDRKTLTRIRRKGPKFRKLQEFLTWASHNQNKILNRE